MSYEIRFDPLTINNDLANIKENKCKIIISYVKDAKFFDFKKKFNYAEEEITHIIEIFKFLKSLKVKRITFLNFYFSIHYPFSTLISCIKFIEVKNIKFVNCHLVDYAGYFKLCENKTFLSDIIFKNCNFNLGDANMVIEALENNYRILNLKIKEPNFGEMISTDDIELQAYSQYDIEALGKINKYITRNKSIEMVRRSSVQLILIRKYRDNKFLSPLDKNIVLKIAKMIYTSQMNVLKEHFNVSEN